MQLPLGLVAALGGFPVPTQEGRVQYSIGLSVRKMVNNSAWLPLLILWNVPRETESQKLPHSFKYASYEVTIPRKVMPRYGKQESSDVTYHLQIEGKGRMVHLMQKRSFIPKNFPVFTYSKQGERQVNYPFIRTDCFYQGYIEGKPSSSVILSICSGGFRGLFQLENNTYEIEPVPASSIFQHVVYRLEEMEADASMMCGLTKEEESHQDAMIQKAGTLTNKSVSGRAWWLHTRYVKIAVVVEYGLFMRFERNETLTTIQVLNVIHIANTRYEPLAIHLYLAGLEIWSEQNYIAINKSMNDTLTSFTQWRKKSLLKRLSNDVGHLFMYMKYFGVAGLAYLGSVCNKDKGSGVLAHITYSLTAFSNVFVHELGHNLGMRHDKLYCACGQPTCIMESRLVNSYKFSNCNYIDYFRLKDTQCLLIPPSSDLVLKLSQCGNKIVEKGEQCDCGSKIQCRSDPCCEPGCRFRRGASCAFGECCAKCRYLRGRSLCRQNTSICDLPEYCSGNSEICPKDVYVQDGAPCSNGAYCYRGNCTTHNEQCKMMFGQKAAAAPKDCFRELNTQGDRFGNCGFKHGRYTKCSPADILCGRIQCKNVLTLPIMKEHTTLIQTNFDGWHCWGTDYHLGMDTSDTGAVIDGTPCGKDLMCINQKCVNTSLLNYDCDLKICNHRGVCNSNKNCHCIYGWAPPYCDKKGYGGSIDSGPPPRKNLTNAQNLFRYIFIPIVCIGVLLVVVFRNDLIYFYNRLSQRLNIFEVKKPTKTPSNVRNV